MPQGLQVWDAAGNLIVDTSTRIYKEFEIVDVTADGDIDIPAVDGATPTVVATTKYAPGSGAQVQVEVDPADAKVRWKFNGGSGVERVRVALL